MQVPPSPGRLRGVAQPSPASRHTTFPPFPLATGAQAPTCLWNDESWAWWLLNCWMEGVTYTGDDGHLPCPDPLFQQTLVTMLLRKVNWAWNKPFCWPESYWVDLLQVSSTPPPVHSPKRARFSSLRTQDDIHDLQNDNLARFISSSSPPGTFILQPTITRDDFSISLNIGSWTTMLKHF